ncbi:ATP-binding cassette domain-containing protein, partial [Pseudomonas aeruginosa]|uniref:ATP-binding cassette domain-containing protein n=1 Tax=Pseudomonas aeruginosa TaxID=287 RepID=UPI0013A5A420
MPLISLTGAYLAFSDAPLLDNTDLFIDENERVCLVGRNGAGKSTLLRVLAKEQPLDDGQVEYEQDLVTARLQQDPPRDIEGTIFDFVAQGVAEDAQYITEYHRVSK